jgi:hypothetical protein
MPRKKGSKNKAPTGDWKQIFLKALQSYPVVRVACEQAGVSRAEVYRQRTLDPEFAQAWENAKDDGIDILEAKMHERARDKDTLAAIFLLKHLRPSVYADNVQLNVSGSLSIEEVTSARATLKAKLAQIEQTVAPGVRRLQQTES